MTSKIIEKVKEIQDPARHVAFTIILTSKLAG